MNPRAVFILLLLASGIAACEKETHELKSPCVGAEGSPCGEKRSVNEWWMRQA